MYSEEGACEMCGEALPVRRRQDMRTCSARCRTARSRAPVADTVSRGCARCGEPLTGKQRVYCGKLCSRAAYHERERGPKLDRTAPISCKRCGVGVQPKADGPLPTYCSGACRAADGYEKAREDGRYEEWRAADRAAYVPIIHALVCQREDCAAPFTSKRPDAKWCSEPCSRRAYNARREEDGRLAKYRSERRQRQRAQTDDSEVFRAVDVMERDDWTCWLCAEPIDREATWPAPLSRSVDHVVPLSKGGAHALSNVRAAHLRCNLVKGDRLVPTEEAA